MNCSNARSLRRAASPPRGANVAGFGHAPWSSRVMGVTTQGDLRRAGAMQWGRSCLLGVVRNDCPSLDSASSGSSSVGGEGHGGENGSIGTQHPCHGQAYLARMPWPSRACSMLSTNACSEAAMMLVLTPTVPHSRLPSVEVMRTRVRAAVPATPSRMRTL